MKKKLLHLYAEEWEWFRTKVLTLFLITFFVFVAASVAYYIYYVGQPDKAQSKILEFQEIFPRIKQNATGWERALWFFTNNAKVSFLDITSGLIPLLFWPFVKIIRMGSLMGVLSSAIHMQGYNPLLVHALGIAPHGIIEIPAATYSTCLGIMLCFRVSKKLLATLNPFPWKAKVSPLFSAEHEECEPLSSFILRCFKSWLLVIAPLLLIAALIEGFITPLLLTSFP